MNPAASRATQNSAIPSNQNTAPILDFRCLYTHDLRKKKKKWHDGVLRFHTFNKRIMVYDVPMNFIGDMHWRNSEVVQDGDELELDRGILIQVGEATGSKDQDISEVFAKRRPIQESPQVHTVQRSFYPTNVASTAAPITQLRPKSLNEVLGTPRGTYGRAALPAKSPFEERKSLQHSDDEQGHPAKRQRIDVLEEDTPNPISPPVQSQARQLTRQASSNRQQMRVPKTSALTNHVTSEGTDIGADDFGHVVCSPAKGATSNPLRLTEVPLLPAEVIPNATSTVLNRPIAPKPGIAQKASETRIINRPTAPVPPHFERTELPLSHAQIPDRTPRIASAKPKDDDLVNPLRFAPGKARRKLIYQELLPKEFFNKPSPVSSRSSMKNILETDKRRSGNCATSNSNDSEIPERATNSHAHVLDISLSSKPPSHERNMSKLSRSRFLNRQLHATETDYEETIFISQEPPTSNTAVELARLDEAFLGRREAPKNQPDQTPCPRTVAPGLQGVRRSLLSFAMTTIAEAPVTAVHKPLPEQSPQASTTLIPQSPPQSQRVPSSQPAHDSLPSPAPQPPLIYSRPKPSLSPPKQQLPLPLPALINPAKQRPFRRVTSEVMSAKSTPRQSLQRSGSDITDQMTGPASVERPVPEEGKKLGPWSREAFDLFGWRPGEPKGIGAG